MSEELATLKAIEAKIEQLLKWTRLAGLQQLRDILNQNLTTDKEMLVYELSDGERGTRELAKLTGLGSNATIAAYWRKWSKIGIVEPSPKYKGRFQRICSLEEVGLALPPMSHTETSLAVEEDKEEVEDDRESR
jgi:hypothetical protein